MDRQVHRRSRRHEALEEAGGQRPGPAAQVQGADEASPRRASPCRLDLDLYGCLVLVYLGRRASQGGGHEKHPKLAASQGVDGEPGPRQQAPQLVDSRANSHTA